MATVDERARRALIIAGATIAGLTGLRLVLAAEIGLAPDEAYYWQWSSDLALTYPDHPPLVAWLIRLGTAIVGESSLGVRLMFVLTGIPAAILVYRIGRALELDPAMSAVSAVLATLLPAPAVASLLATPDTPLGLCWLVAALALARLASTAAPKNWYVLGCALGLGLLSKHTAVLLIPAVLLAVFLAQRIRADLRTVHPWLALVLALVIASPYLVAELGAESPSFALQLQHLSGDLPTGEATGLAAIPLRLGALIGGQLGLLTPLVALMVVVLLVRRRPLAPGWRVSVSLVLLPMLATAVAAIFVHPEQNWAALGHPLAALLAIGAVTLPLRDGSTANRTAWSLSLLFSVALLTGLVHWHATGPLLPLPADRDPVSRLRGWSGLAALDSELARSDAAVCDNYGLAAELAWHTRRVSSPPPIVGQDRAHDPPGENWLLLEERNDWSGAELAVSCDAIEPIRELQLARDDGEPIRTIALSRGRGCRPAESPRSAAR